jgi:uncharacterized spore protein YtfJ
MNNSPVEVLRTLGDRLQSGASVNNVFGEAIGLDGKTVVPVARVRYGFGGGGGKYGSADAAEDRGSEPRNAGWGGGGGVIAEPAGVLEITAAETRFIPFLDPKRTALLVGAGFVFGVLFSSRRRLKD